MSQQINLISPLLLKKRYAFGLNQMALGLGVVLAGSLAWGGVLHYQAGALETRAAQQEALQAAAQQELDQLSVAATRPASALLAGRVKATQVQVKQREALLASIGGTLEQTATGFSPRMRALAQSDTEGVWLNGFTLAQDHVVLKGSALNAGVLTAYLDRLGQQAAFSGTRFSGMDAVPGQSAGADGTDRATLPEYIDFALHSGGSENAANEGGSHGQ
jgi:Fimbrial assembly protein (PilN)